MTSTIKRSLTSAAVALCALFFSVSAFADEPKGEMNLVLPDFKSVQFVGMSGWNLLAFGLIVCALGLVFGLVIFQQLKRLPVHKSMLEVSELIYETCKTYLYTQVKFIVLLEVLIGAVIGIYFGALLKVGIPETLIILVFSVIGIAGSVGVAWFGIRVNTFANSRTAFAALRGKPFPCYQIPLKAGMSIGMLLISTELLMMLIILLFVPREIVGYCFLGFAIGESLGASALRIAGGIFTKIADIGSDLMKIVFNIKEDDARNPGVIADCTGDNAGDSVGPTADGFETYGVTGVALIAFITLAVNDIDIQDPDSRLRWYFPVPEAGYGFCAACGSSLFWQSTETPARRSICAGTLNTPTGLKTGRAIWVSEASDYHDRPELPELATE